MNSQGAGSTDRELWQRWRALGMAPSVTEPDALLLAAYAEGRLSETEAEAIEAWLATEPEEIDDVIAAREINQRPPRIVYQHILNNACRLISETEAESAPQASNVVPFRRRLPQWRTALAWSSVAASLLCASMVGFSMGSDVYASLSQTQTVDTSSSDSFDTPSTLDSYLSDDSST